MCLITFELRQTSVHYMVFCFIGYSPGVSIRTMQPRCAGIVPLLLLVFLYCLSSCGIRSDLKHESFYSKEELKQLRRCNTARFSCYMRKRSRRIIHLSNLLRVEPSLLSKYIILQTDSNLELSAAYRVKTGKRGGTWLPSKTPLLRPSFGLYLSSKMHALVSGISGTTGHQELGLRMRLGLNWNMVYGENCIYGHENQYDMIVGWIESSGHYQNLVNQGYYRVGVSGFWHSKYGNNYVQVFSGKKLFDLMR